MNKIQTNHKFRNIAPKRQYGNFMIALAITFLLASLALAGTSDFAGMIAPAL